MKRVKLDKSKSKKFKLIQIALIIIIFGVFVFIFKNLENYNYINGIKKFVEKDTKVVYISDNENYSSYPIELLSKYEINYLYINSSSLSGIEKSKLEKIFNSKYLNDILIVFKDGKITDAIIGYESEEKLVEFLKKNDIIPKTLSEPDKIIAKLDKLLEQDMNIIYIPYVNNQSNLEQEKLVETIANEYNLKYDIVEAYLLSFEQQKKINLTLDISDVEGQILILVKDNKIVGNLRGTFTREKIIEELRNLKILETDLNKVVEIDYDLFSKIVDSNEKSVIILGKSECKYCNDAINTLNKVANDYDFKVNYLNVESFESETFKKVKERLEKMEYKDGITTPLIIVTESKKILTYMIGKSSYEYYVDELTEYGIIK